MNFMKLGFAIVVLCLAALTGCATVPKGDTKQDFATKKFQAKPGVAGLYIYRNESIGGAIRMDVEIDGKPVGQTAAKTYLYKELPPGKHTVTSKSENDDTVEIDTAAGKLYYVWQEVKLGILYARTKLHLVGEDEGKKGVLETQLAETK